MSTYVVTHATTEESSFGEEGRLAAKISDEFPDARRQPDGAWLIVSDRPADDILSTLSEGLPEESVMICAIADSP